MIVESRGIIVGNGLQDFVTYWRKVFSSEDPIKTLGLNEFEHNMKQFEIDVAPEPYYGYFHEDMSNDVLLLLLNPGAKDDRTSEQGWNASVKQRYVHLWSKNEYHVQEEILKGLNKWRDKRFNQATGIVGEVGFLHTMEFFPFHSRKDELTENFKRDWVNHFTYTDIAFQALKDIAINRKVKHIFSVSNDWIRILEKHGVPLTNHIILKKDGGKDYSFQFKVYQISENALPILFCDLKGSPMNLPRNSFAVQVARNLLGLTNLPVSTAHPLFEITVIK
jgi:hypothetical protein